MYYPWLVDEGAAARLPKEQPGHPFPGYDEAAALTSSFASSHSTSPWMEEACLGALWATLLVADRRWLSDGAAICTCP